MVRNRESCCTFSSFRSQKHDREEERDKAIGKSSPETYIMIEVVFFMEVPEVVQMNYSTRPFSVTGLNCFKTFILAYESF